MIVLDAAAIVDVVLDQATASWVLDQLVGQEVVAPAHQPAEVLSAIARLVRSGEIEASTAADALDEYAVLDQVLVSPSPEHLRRAIALQDRIRVLDGLYVALAEDRSCALVTTDRRLGGADAQVEVRVPPPREAHPRGSELEYVDSSCRSPVPHRSGSA